MNERVTLTADQLAETLGVSKDTLYQAARRGELPFARRIGRRWIFPRAGVDNWLNHEMYEKNGNGQTT